MRIVGKFAAALVCAVFLPTVAYAQASLAGVARDASGAVLPGVTVEAASPVLIEKVRVTVTDGAGRYQLIDLRPGEYVVTFTLPGFATVQNEGVVLAGTATVAVDAEMRVGALEETITVTGEAPIVDTSSASRQVVLDANTIDALPTSRSYLTLARLIPAAVGGGDDVGGSNLQRTGGSVTVHGSRSQDQRVTLNGVNTMTLQAGGHLGGQGPDFGAAAEVTIDHTGVSADLPTGGIRINLIPRDGGNTWANSSFFSFTNENLQGTNFDAELQAAGLRAPSAIQKNFDFNTSFGGPIVQDKLWYWASYRRNHVNNYAPIFDNLNAYNPDVWTYAPSTNQSLNTGREYKTSLRLTWQATPRNKFAGTYKYDAWCGCPEDIIANRTKEAVRDGRFPRLVQEHGEWTSPVSNNLLLEAVGMHLFERWGAMHNEGAKGSAPEFAAIAPQMISVTDQGLGNLRFRAPDQRNNNTKVPNFYYRAAASYITGTHNFKVGFNRVHGFLDERVYSLNNMTFRFRDGVPNRLTLRGYPYKNRSHQDNDIGFYAQDRIQLNQMTIGLAIRYDHFGSSFPEQSIGPSEFTPNRNATFPAQDNLGWNDITYRTAFTYDLRGDGRTAIKATVNKYLRGQTLNTLGDQPNPLQTLVDTVNINWNDANRNFVPDCDLLNPNPNGECGGYSNRAFGTVTPGATFDPILLTGFGNRESNWEFSAGVQQEVLPRVSVDVGYFRRIWQNLRVTDNLAVSASDYDFFDMVVPNDPRLPNAGELLTGIPALKQSAFGRASQNHNTLDRVFGGKTEHWNGVDVTVDARLNNGLVVNGGVSTGKTSFDNCNVENALPESQFSSGRGNPTGWLPRGNCAFSEPWLTNVKGYAVYELPAPINVQVAATFRSVPGRAINSEFIADNAYLAANSTLGRPLAGGARNHPVVLLPRRSNFLERRNELDLRFGYVLRAGRSRSVISLDLFNAINANPVLSANDALTRWLAPQSILNARLAKVSVQFDF